MKNKFSIIIQKIIDHWIKFKSYSKGKLRLSGNEKLRNNILQAIPFWFASLLSGLAGVFYARLFLFSEQQGLQIIQQNRWSIFILLPLSFIFSWYLSRRFAPYASGSGIPQVMAGIELSNPKQNHLVDSLLSVRVLVVKIIGGLVMVFGGGAVGREGPTVQIASAIFRIVNKFIPESWPKVSKKNVIIAGAAAGLSAAFNTPLGGIVFAIEELSKTHISYFITALFSAVIIAGLTAQAFLGPYLYLGYPPVTNLSWFLFLPVILVALFSGISGALFGKFLFSLVVLRKKFGHKKYSGVIFCCIAALIMSVIYCFVNPLVIGSGKDSMNHLLFNADKNTSLSNFLARFAGPLLSYVSGGVGGIFAPALSAGAEAGALIASWFNFSATETNVLILSGMVGFLTGVTRTPFTSAILVLEMTDRHSIIFHLMLAGMIAGIAALVVDRRSFYEKQMEVILDEMKGTIK